MGQELIDSIPLNQADQTEGSHLPPGRSRLLDRTGWQLLFNSLLDRVTWKAKTTANPQRWEFSEPFVL
ncbi:hypothetical protein THTE_2721 [Thermogutta terrifontis]|uniref:Uncharacterized protein n=1 Tax=Thermogutta terrifontis TaxID=1331910 RepID=A0A286RH88_9BACT|nr:hypothetical protein THTE_2721 [Thermogutta terrifontis]